MKICPIMINRTNISDKGLLSHNKFSSQNKLNYQNQNDVFVRLAIASTRDSKIENELKSMNLI